MATLVRCDLQLEDCEGDVPQYDAFRLDVDLSLPSNGRRAQFGSLAGQEIPGGHLRRVVDACGPCIEKIGPLAGLLHAGDEYPPAQLGR